MVITPDGELLLIAGSLLPALVTLSDNALDIDIADRLSYKDLVDSFLPLFLLTTCLRPSIQESI